MTKLRTALSVLFFLTLISCSSGGRVDAVESAEVPIYRTSSAKNVLTELGDPNSQIGTQAVSQEEVLKNLETHPLILHRFSNGKTIVFENKRGFAFREGDIAVTSSRENAASILKYENYLSDQIATNSLVKTWQCSFWLIWCWNSWDAAWPNKQIPYELDASLTATERTVLINSASNWNAKSINVKWVQNSSAVDRVKFSAYDVDDKSCGGSQVGRQKGIQYFGINRRYNCFTNRTIHHEMAHAAGVEHEQNRCNRDDFVQVLTENITQGMESNFTKTCDVQHKDVGVYDFGSLMHYSRAAFSRNGLNTIVVRSPLGSSNYTGAADTSLIGSGTQLTNNDISGLNSLYP